MICIYNNNASFVVDLVFVGVLYLHFTVNSIIRLSEVLLLWASRQYIFSSLLL